MPAFYGANNHGGIIRLSSGDEYVFYHRHTDCTNFSRQGCIERIRIEDFEYRGSGALQFEKFELI